MNNLLSFWFAPVTAFFHRSVYEKAVRSSGSRGVFYALYLAGLSAILVMVFLSLRLAPLADAFVDWTKVNMPVLIWTPVGLSLENGQTTATLTHPQYGVIARFDMTKTGATEADMGGAYVLVTSQKVFVKRSPGQIEERDITQAGMRPGQQLPPRVRITGEIAGKMYQNIKSGLAVATPFLTLIVAFALVLMTNLFYSLAGLLFNLMRTEKLGYGAIFNLTCFATSVTFTLTWLRVLTPLQALAFPFVLNLLVNLGYMFFAFKVTDKKKEVA